MSVEITRRWTNRPGLGGDSALASGYSAPWIQELRGAAHEVWALGLSRQVQPCHRRPVSTYSQQGSVAFSGGMVGARRCFAKSASTGTRLRFDSYGYEHSHRSS